MRIKRHINDIALDSPAYILSYCLSVVRNKYTRPQWNKGGIHRNDTVPDQCAACRVIRIPRILRTIGRSDNRDDPSLRLAGRRLIMTQLCIGPRSTDTINLQAVCLLEFADRLCC